MAPYQAGTPPPADCPLSGDYLMACSVRLLPDELSRGTIVNLQEQLIIKARKMLELTSDAKLALKMQVTAQTLSQWKRGDVPLSDERIFELARYAGDDAVWWLFAIQEERATDPDVKNELKQQKWFAAAIDAMPADVKIMHWVSGLKAAIKDRATDDVDRKFAMKLIRELMSRAAVLIMCALPISSVFAAGSALTSWYSGEMYIM